MYILIVEYGEEDTKAMRAIQPAVTGHLIRAPAALRPR